MSLNLMTKHWHKMCMKTGCSAISWYKGIRKYIHLKSDLFLPFDLGRKTIDDEKNKTCTSSIWRKKNTFEQNKINLNKKKRKISENVKETDTRIKEMEGTYLTNTQKKIKHRVNKTKWKQSEIELAKGENNKNTEVLTSSKPSPAWHTSAHLVTGTHQSASRVGIVANSIQGIAFEVLISGCVRGRGGGVRVWVCVW